MKYIYGILFLFSQNSFSQTITYAEDVACILNTHCKRCHNNSSNGSLAAISFTNYDEAWSQRKAIQYYVQSKKMPPYFPSTESKRYVHEKSLTQSEIDIIVTWVNQGSQQGDSLLTPPTPSITPLISNILSPDFSKRIPTYTVPNLVAFQYHCFVFPVTYSVEKHIAQIEILPTNTSAVYSAFLYSDTSAVPLTLDANDSSNGYENYSGIGSPTAKLLYGWVNGNPLYHLPPNLALRLEPNAHLVLRVLYAEDAFGKTDSTQVNIKFDVSGGVRVADVAKLLNHNSTLMNPPFIIPPDSIKTFYEQTTIGSNISFLGISPLGHKFCSSLNCYAVTPANDTLILLDVEDHEDLWSQGFYYFDKPIKIPSGTVLYASADFDNTSFNPNNPFSPAHTILAGITDTTEAMQFSFMYLPYQKGDENIVADTVLHQVHYLNCSPAHRVGISQIENNTFNIKAYPNPSNDFWNIEGSTANKIISAEIFDVLGRTVFSVLPKQQDNDFSFQINNTSLNCGMYFLKIQTINYIQNTHLIKN